MKQSEEPSLREEAKKFGETVSVRGVSKVLKSRNWFLRIFWLVSVFASLSILVWQLSAVFVKYFKYPIDTTVEEGNTRAGFPDVTICNIYPITDISSDLTWEEYLDDIKIQRNSFSLEIVNSWNADWNMSLEEYEEVWNELQTPAGYFLNFPIIDGNGSSGNRMIIDCKYLDWSWSTMNHINCMANIRMIWNPTYYQCYTLSLPDVRSH